MAASGWRRRRGIDEFALACRDLANQRHEVIVTASGDGRVVVVVPPGETAVLTLQQVGQLRASLRDAAEHAAELEGARDERAHHDRHRRRRHGRHLRR